MNNVSPKAQALVFDLGGTNLRCAVWDSSVGITRLRRTRIDNFLNTEGLDVVWNKLLLQIAEFASSVANLISVDSPIIVSFPGPVESHRRILQAPTFFGEGRIPDLVDALEQRTGRKTYLLNDISAAAWHISMTSPVTRFMV